MQRYYPRLGQNHSLPVRIQRRAWAAGTCTASSYFSAGGVLDPPTLLMCPYSANSRRPASNRHRRKSAIQRVVDRVEMGPSWTARLLPVSIARRASAAHDSHGHGRYSRTMKVSWSIPMAGLRIMTDHKAVLVPTGYDSGSAQRVADSPS